MQEFDIELAIDTFLTGMNYNEKQEKENTEEGGEQE